MEGDPDGNLGLLSSSLMIFLHDEELRLTDARPSRWQLWKQRAYAFGQRLNRVWYRSLLAGLMIGGGMIGIGRAWGLLAAIFTDIELIPTLQRWLMEGRFHTFNELRWLMIRIGLEWVLGALLLTAALLLMLRRERTAIDLGVVTLTLLLTTVDLLVFYFDQFSAVTAALAQYALLALLLAYRQWYLRD
jgi:hypothetical protein